MICRNENREINPLAVSRLLHNNGPYIVYQEIKSIGIDSLKVSQHGFDLLYMFLKQSSKVSEVFECKKLISLLGKHFKFHIYSGDIVERSAAVLSLLATEYSNCYHLFYTLKPGNYVLLCIV